MKGNQIKNMYMLSNIQRREKSIKYTTYNHGSNVYIYVMLHPRSRAARVQLSDRSQAYRDKLVPLRNPGASI